MDRIVYFIVFITGFFISWGEGMQRWLPNASSVYSICLALLMFIYRRLYLSKKSAIFIVPRQYKGLLMFMLLHTCFYLLFNFQNLTFGKELLVEDGDYVFQTSGTGDVIVRYLMFSLFSFLLPYLLSIKDFIKPYIIGYAIGFTTTIFGGYSGEYSELARLSGGLKDPNAMALDAIVVICLLLYFLYRNDCKLYIKYIIYFMIVICIVSIILSFSRGCMLAGLTSIIFYLYKQGKFSKVVSGLVVFLIVIIIGSMFIPEEIKTAIELRFSIGQVKETGGAGREEIWYEYIKYWYSYIFVGSGLGNCQSVLFENGSSEYRVTHNQYLKYLVEFGFFGFILYMRFIMKGISICKKSLSQYNFLVLPFISMLVASFFMNIDSGRTYWVIVSLVNYAWLNSFKNNETYVRK